MGHGGDAFYQIFHEDISGEFSFRGEEVCDSVPVPIARTPMNLLLEAMRMKDESRVILRAIDDFQRVFIPCRNTLK